MSIKTAFLIFALAVLILSGCTPGAVKFNMLCPVSNPNIYIGSELVSESDYTDVPKEQVEKLKKFAVIIGDSVAIAISVLEYPNLLGIDFFLMNMSSSRFYLSPDDFLLLDGSKTAMRRLMPHEAANVMIANCSGIPSYQPKYNYHVETSVSGSINTTSGSGGYYSTYSGQAHSNVYAEEDPWNALGYALGAAIVESGNKKIEELASGIYSFGIVPNTAVEPDSNIRGGVYWLNRKDAQYPMILRIAKSGLEIRFTGCDVRRMK